VRGTLTGILHLHARTQAPSSLRSLCSCLHSFLTDSLSASHDHKTRSSSFRFDFFISSSHRRSQVLLHFQTWGTEGRVNGLDYAPLVDSMNSSTSRHLHLSATTRSGCFGALYDSTSSHDVMSYSYWRLHWWWFVPTLRFLFSISMCGNPGVSLFSVSLTNILRDWVQFLTAGSWYVWGFCGI
jgi:hypothetical protein